ncbi:MAG: PIN domain-containing protein [Acidimicrobiales bacterium]
MSAVLAVDTSVVVPALVSTHEAHAVARAILAERPGIPADVVLESYSVLTRLPFPLRVRGPVAAELLARTFVEVMSLAEEDQRTVVATLAAKGVSGGAAYDGIVALTARRVEAQLCTRDRRARATYEALGVDVRWVA